MNMLFSFLHHNRERLKLDRYGAGDLLSYVLVTPRFWASSHVVFLILPHGGSEPVLVAKVPRLPNARVSVEREAANLRTIQASRMEGVDSIPQVIAFEEYQGYPILVETALSGRLMDPKTVRRDLAGCCKAVTGWLAEVQQLAHSPSEIDPNWFWRLAEQPLRYFEERFPLSAEEAQLLERTWELIAPLRGANLPLVFEHGDLSHPNIILRNDGGIGVVDWELAEVYGLPACDLFFFLTYAAFAQRKARSADDYLLAFQAAFFGDSAWVRPYVEAYAAQLQLSAHLFMPLFVLCWARYVAGLLMRLSDAEHPQGQLRPETVVWLRGNRYYTLWKHTVTYANELVWSSLP